MRKERVFIVIVLTLIVALIISINTNKKIKAEKEVLLKKLETLQVALDKPAKILPPEVKIKTVKKYIDLTKEQKKKLAEEWEQRSKDYETELDKTQEMLAYYRQEINEITYKGEGYNIPFITSVGNAMSGILNKKEKKNMVYAVYSPSFLTIGYNRLVWKNFGVTGTYNTRQEPGIGISYKF